MLDSIIKIIVRGYLSLSSLCIGAEICSENSIIVVNNNLIEANEMLSENQTSDEDEFPVTNHSRNLKKIECRRVVDGYTKRVKEDKYFEEALNNYIDLEFEMERWRDENPNLVRQCENFNQLYKSPPQKK